MGCPTAVENTAQVTYVRTYSIGNRHTVSIASTEKKTKKTNIRLSMNGNLRPQMMGLHKRPVVALKSGKSQLLLSGF